MQNRLPDAAFLRECFEYDEMSGRLTWKTRPLNHFDSENGHRVFNIHNAGKSAGNPTFRVGGSPHRITIGIRVLGKLIYFAAHRLIFALQGIAIPDDRVIDHRDGNPFNNALSNLRVATSSQNRQNSTKKSGKGFPKGVWLYRGKLRACIRHAGKQHFLGSFDSVEEAAAAYNEAATKLHGDFAKLNAA